MFGFFSFYVSISKRYIIPPHGSNIREHWLHKRCAVNEACSNISFITLPEFCYKELNRTGESLDQVQGSSQWAAEEREFLVREKLSAVKAFSPLCSSANVFSAVCSPPHQPWHKHASPGIPISHPNICSAEPFATIKEWWGPSSAWLPYAPLLLYTLVMSAALRFKEQNDRFGLFHSAVTRVVTAPLWWRKRRLNLDLRESFSLLDRQHKVESLKVILLIFKTFFCLVILVLGQIPMPYSWMSSSALQSRGKGEAVWVCVSVTQPRILPHRG